ncbi:Fc.00g047960.m01.CDS01 [Cosmosporella sp. VM-42]
MSILAIQHRGTQLSSATALFTLGVVGADVDLGWYAPASTKLNNLTHVLNGEGVYGFIYDSSRTPDGKYGTYNWCNMPHVRSEEYVKASDEFELRYVEVTHRHHKQESYQWNCDDVALFYTSEPLGDGYTAAKAYLSHFQVSENHFVADTGGWQGSCEFPQITAEGLEDSYIHGLDLFGVYHDLLGFLPDRSDSNWQSKVQYRVTNNPITSQVASMLIEGMWQTSERIPLLIDFDGIDSLMPQAFCAAGEDLFRKITSFENSAWQEHLELTKDLYAVLDELSGVPSNGSGFHRSFDHYYDNLSARQCHAKPLPCKLVDGKNDTSSCFTQQLAHTVYRLGNWEYSQTYRDAPDSLAASASTYGIWIATLANHLRAAVNGSSSTVYFHNVAHDGSISRLLSILQLDEMVWPGMGAEVVFELYRKKDTTSFPTLSSTENGGVGSDSGFYIRVLFGGQALKSSNPSLGDMNLIPVEILLAYLDGLAGKDAEKVLGLCKVNYSLTE